MTIFCGLSSCVTVVIPFVRVAVPSSSSQSSRLSEMPYALLVAATSVSLHAYSSMMSVKHDVHCSCHLTSGELVPWTLAPGGLALVCKLLGMCV